jgi:hypothetical protein
MPLVLRCYKVSWSPHGPERSGNPYSSIDVALPVWRHSEKFGILGRKGSGKTAIFKKILTDRAAPQRSLIKTLMLLRLMVAFPTAR